MGKLILVRHGRTPLNAPGNDERLRGWLDIPLDEHGLEEAEEAGERLRDCGKRLRLCGGTPSLPCWPRMSFVRGIWGCSPGSGCGIYCLS